MNDFTSLFLNNVSSTETAATLPLFKEYAWNFDKNCFELDGDGRQIVLTGNEALKIWLQKAFSTERLKYLAYSSSYGFDGQKLIGKVISVGERRAELKRSIIECISVSPYILSINSIEFNESGTDLTVNIHLTTIYGDLNL